MGLSQVAGCYKHRRDHFCATTNIVGCVGLDCTREYNRVNPLFFGILVSIAEQLRDLIKESGRSLNAISKECGVPQPMINRFVHGRDITLTTAVKLMEHFNLKLVVDKPKKSPKK